MLRVLLLLSCLLASVAMAAEPVFDVHVHLRDGEASLREYQADVARSGATVVARFARSAAC